MKKFIKILLRVVFGKRCKRIKNIISKKDFEIISFDIFDTLILRRVKTPEMIFINVQNKVLKWDKLFCENRKMSEKRARCKIYPKEITLDDIYYEYQNLSGLEKNIVENIMRLEIEEELNACQVNTEMYDVYSFCEVKGIQILITSDMYLPQNIIEKILFHAGYGGYKKLYLSSEKGMTKKSGKLFEIIMKEQNIKPEKILHIGDNPLGDFLVPMSKGIKSILLSNTMARGIKIENCHK